MGESRFRGRTKVKPWSNLGSSSGQNPQQVFVNTQSREAAKQPFDIAAEQRKLALEGQTTKEQQKARIATRTLSQDERSDELTFDTIQGHIDYLEGLMDKDPNRFQEAFSKAMIHPSGIATLMDRDAINIRKTMNDWNDLLLRARSKSQTTEKEFSRLRSINPNLFDISVNFDPETGQTFPTIRRDLQKARSIIQSGKNMIRSGSLALEEDNDPLGVF